MNNDIKEILNYLDMYKNMDEGLLNSKDKKLLLDYITNLQNKIKDLEDTIIDKHECIVAQNDTITNLQEENERLKQSKKETLECLKEFHNYENRFKWYEEDYIDTINMFEKKVTR